MKGPIVTNVGYEAGQAVVHHRLALAAVAMAVCLAGLATPVSGQQGEDARSDRAARLAEMSSFGERSVVKPSQDSVMGFNLSTSVKEILVAGGQRVSAGDLLVRGDDSEDLAEAEFQRARAETKLPTDRAKAQFDLAQLEFERQEKTFIDGAGSQLELDRARVTRDTARIDYDLAILNERLSELQATRAEARAAKLSLRAPFEGIVDLVHVDLGQTVREGDPVVRVVSVDPLWMDVPAPMSVTLEQGIAVGSSAWVLLQQDVADRVYEARVIEVAPTADAASGRRRVRVEMANAIGLVPGVNCWVRFTKPTGRWADLVVDPGDAASALRGETTPIRQAMAAEDTR